MPRDSKVNPFEEKRIARQKYVERQIDKFVKWSWDVRGKVKYKELMVYSTRCLPWCFNRSKELQVPGYDDTCAIPAVCRCCNRII